MITLTSSPLAPVLDRLFQEAEAASGQMGSVMASVSSKEQERLMRSKTEYRHLYGQLKELPLPVSRQAGTLLYMLARESRATNIVEFGTSFGISTLHLAAAVRDNGGGRVITTEFEPEKAARARRNLSDGGLLDLVEIREGDALQTLARDLPDSIDLLFLDGAKALYSEVLDLVESRLRHGAILVADNVDYCPEYMARVCSPENGYLSVSFGDDVEVSMRFR